MLNGLDRDYGVVASRHPHIARGLKFIRGYPETATFVTKLLEDTRGGTRKGFEPGVLDALLNIQRGHMQQTQHTIDESNPWGNARDFYR